MGDHWFEEAASHMGEAYLRYSFTKGTEQEVKFLINQLKHYVDSNGSSFNGMIVSVDKSGIINIEKEDGSINTYNFQEIQTII